VRDYQQPDRLLYIAFSSFLGVVEDDMDDSYENSLGAPLILACHIALECKQAGMRGAPRIFIISFASRQSPEELL